MGNSLEVAGAPCLVHGTHEIGINRHRGAHRLFAIDLQIRIRFPIFFIRDFSRNNAVGDPPHRLRSAPEHTSHLLRAKVREIFERLVHRSPDFCNHACC